MKNLLKRSFDYFARGKRAAPWYFGAALAGDGWVSGIEFPTRYPKPKTRYPLAHYLFMLIRSCSISSTVVTTLVFAWKPR
jgi:hypothetical protein